MIRCLLLLVLLALAACHPCPRCVAPVVPAPLPEVHVTTEQIPSLETEPPEAPTVKVIGPKGGCPAPWAGCLERADLDALDLYVDALETWAARAWVRAGRKPPAPEDDE